MLKVYLTVGILFALVVMARSSPKTWSVHAVDLVCLIVVVIVAWPLVVLKGVRKISG